jgi:hypothetical protein
MIKPASRAPMSLGSSATAWLFRHHGHAASTPLIASRRSVFYVYSTLSTLLLLCPFLLAYRQGAIGIGRKIQRRDQGKTNPRPETTRQPDSSAIVRLPDSDREVHNPFRTGRA